MGRTEDNSASIYQEQELIKQLAKLRTERGETLGYETFEDYEVPPRTQFPMLKKPAVTIKYKHLSFSTSSIRLFEGIKYILPILNPIKKRFVAVPLSAEESKSIEWARQNKEGCWVPKDVVSLEFVEKIYALMNWNRECRFKVMGEITDSPRGLVLLFKMEDAMMFSNEAVEYIDPNTGEVKKSKIIYYPDAYKGRIGQSYSDYIASQNSALYDQFSEITGNTYDTNQGDNMSQDGEAGE